MKKQIKILAKLIPILFFIILAPLTAYAQGSMCTGGGIGGAICKLNELLGSIVPFIVGLGVIYFIWGVLQYVIAGGDEAKSKGKDKMIYGIIGLTVVVSVWGLVNLVVDTFNIGGSAPNVTTLVAVPTSTSDCDLSGSNTKFADVLNYFTCIIGKSVIPLIFALAVAMFLWGVVQFVINSDDEGKKSKGKQFMLWGIIALAVMFSVWGLVGILTDTFGINNSFLPTVKPN